MHGTVYEIQEALEEEQMLKCFDLLKLLRPHLERDDFVDAVKRQRDEGYHLIFIEDGEGVRSVAGYRVANYLAWGKVLYIDDLITSPEARGTGFGTHLTKWLMGVAKKLGCDGIHLDTDINQHDSHRLYLNLGLKLDCLHLSMEL